MVPTNIHGAHISLLCITPALVLVARIAGLGRSISMILNALRT